ncbi:hypothetical protein IE331_04160 [Nocardioides sp. MJB4]|uniref:Type IV toxin-antitoxin system AbiEi family antitoxin domain-containing protein n=1 Tax=Nocardioides donggukensis TaxID=2774019 RepID=A0A927Q0U0_9ACTN|nr:hypothetical protein [Nocardioides donggukensis]
MLCADQSGVVSRSQLERIGATKSDIDRLVRRRLLVRQLPGVYVDHTGEPTWSQRAWAGVLFFAPAALSHESAVRAAVGPGWRRHRDSGPIHIAVATGRKRIAPSGYQVHRTRGLAGRVLGNAGPPRVRLEDAVLDVVEQAPDEFTAVALLADVCQSRRTTADRILSRSRTRPRLRNRVWLTGVLADIAEGTCSVLEHGFATRVERAHGLPRPRRQSPGRGGRGPIARDVEYERFGLVVELDGRLFHDSAGQRDSDFDRDLESVVDGRQGVRLSWGQVFDRPCRTAAHLVVLLRRGGWAGAPRRCGPACALESTSWSLRAN